jgi:hypothetical protein
MLHLGHVDPVVVPVRADPFDPHDAFVEIDRHDQTVCVALHIEHDSIRGHDTRGRIGPLQIRRVSPSRLLYLVEPGTQRGFYSGLILVAGQRLHELPQGAAGDDPHAPTLPRAHFGRNDIVVQ